MDSSKMELFFEILRRKTHIFCDVKENATVLEIKKIIEGILKDRQTLTECGYTPQNSRAQAPAPLALVVANEEEDVIIEPLSIPPPVPDAMRPEQAATNEQ
ncbi:hypothetical protein LOAG_04024 [Loa loa]|uniref:Ubiquitin-like domain-containing protein n=1 Tax=Loa loa TaxID=7209 RepID=A0A1S0U4Z5_LOALO|nr:hypothetical protein LOAG_04024 [Loa loa]EFO24465.2 hypothetical protein LOAG_04024 [Loa loa]